MPPRPVQPVGPEHSSGSVLSPSDSEAVEPVSASSSAGSGSADTEAVASSFTVESGTFDAEAPNDVSMMVHVGLLSAAFFFHGYFAEQAFGGIGLYGGQDALRRDCTPWSLVMCLASGIGSVYISLVTWRLCNLEFGSVDMPFSLKVATTAVMIVIMGIMLPTLCPAWFVPRGSTQESFLVDLARPVVELFGMVFFANLRGIPATIPVVVTLLMGCLPSTGGTFGSSYCFLLCAVLFLPLGRARYLRDHRLIMWLAGGSAIFTYAGALLCAALVQRQTGSELMTGSIGYFLVAIVCMCSVVFASRTKRRLPKALQRCKFVRMGYLRKALSLGCPIQRCQEMPDEAFGDPEKANTLLIVSHRWLDRFKCDLPDEGAPHGLRLTLMTRRLNELFPNKVVTANWRRLFDSMSLGGDDVLVFFDFMALPQVGQDHASGELLQRSKRDNEIFAEALPHMGALYTIYPVLVLREVVPGVPPYDSSGWCFTEFCSAMLTKQLRKYSKEALEEYTRTGLFACVAKELTEGTVDDQLEQAFRIAFDADLAKRSFYCEQDRQIVRRIVEGNLVIRRLRDAVRQGSEEDVRGLLERVKEQHLLHVLDHGIDASLDTLLHLAARVGKGGTARLLLEAGASPRLRNFRGDRPDQLFLLPRCSPAASLCRQAVSASPHGEVRMNMGADNKV